MRENHIAPRADILPLDSPLLVAAYMLSAVDAVAVHQGLLHLKKHSTYITYAVHRMEEEGARRRAHKGRHRSVRSLYCEHHA